MKAGFTTSLTGESHPQTDLTGHGFEDVHTSRGNNRDFHYAVINIDYANAFLSSSVQIAPR